MPNASLLTARLLERIKTSSHTLTVHYPAKVTPVAGTAPGPAPLSPLTGTPPTHQVVETPRVPSKPPVTMACLWLDVGQLGDLRRNATVAGDYGWTADADAMARVSATDAASVEGFLGTDRVEHEGRTYRVISALPVGPSFAPAATYTIWLRGAWR
jgi:hypothetical protein